MSGFMPGIHVIAQTALESISTALNQTRRSSFCLSMIFSENRFPLCAGAALRVGIML
jgi:hypothetical protein